MRDEEEREHVAAAERRDERLLGIDPRNLSYYMKKHNLDAGSVEE